MQNLLKNTQTLRLRIKKLEIWPKIRGPKLPWVLILFREKAQRVLLISSHTADTDNTDSSCFFNPAKCHLPALFFQSCLSNSHHRTGHWSDRRTLTPCIATRVWIVCELKPGVTLNKDHWSSVRGLDCKIQPFWNLHTNIMCTYSKASRALLQNHTHEHSDR